MVRSDFLFFFWRKMSITSGTTAACILKMQTPGTSYDRSVTIEYVLMASIDLHVMLHFIF